MLQILHLSSQIKKALFTAAWETKTARCQMPWGRQGQSPEQAEIKISNVLPLGLKRKQMRYHCPGEWEQLELTDALSVRIGNIISSDIQESLRKQKQSDCRSFSVLVTITGSQRPTILTKPKIFQSQFVATLTSCRPFSHAIKNDLITKDLLTL